MGRSAPCRGALRRFPALQFTSQLTAVLNRGCKTCAFAAEKLQPQPRHEGGRVAYVAVQCGGGWPLQSAANLVDVKFAKAGVTAPLTASAMTARRNNSIVEVARRYERPCRRPCKGQAQGTSHGRECMTHGRMALSGPRMYARAWTQVT